MAGDRNVTVRLRAEIAGYKSAMADAAASTRKVADETRRTGAQADTSLGKMVQSADTYGQQWQDVGSAVAGAGAVVVAGLGLAVGSYAKFDQAMSSVSASTHASAADMDALRDAAVNAGADTAFSAAEAAAGIDELAKAGVSTKDILSGGLSGALDLAAAGSLDVATASEIAATALTQFKLSGDQIPHVADLLAAGAGKAQGSVQDLGAALNQSGLVAASTGLSIEETTGTLAAFAAAGLVGSDAGTSFKSMLQRLQNPSKEAAGVMNELKINMYNANGEFVGMSSVAGQLQDSMSNLTQAERDKALATIFGSDAVRAANVLYEQGAAGITSWTDKVNDAGYAAETAALKQDNLIGDLEKLGGSLDSVFLKSGSGANDVLRSITQAAEGIVDLIGQIPGPVLSTVAVLTGLVGAAALVAGGFLVVVPRILATKQALDVLIPSGGKGAAAMTRVGTAARGAATGLGIMAVAGATLSGPLSSLTDPTDEAADALERFAGEAANGKVGVDTLNSSFADLGDSSKAADAFKLSLDALMDPGKGVMFGENLASMLSFVTLGMVDVKTATDEARERFGAMGSELASLDADDAIAAFQSIAASTDGSKESLTGLLELMPAYRDSLSEQAQAAGLATDDQTLLGIAMGTIVPLTQEQATGLNTLNESLGATTSATGFSEEALKEYGDALVDAGLSASGMVVNMSAFIDIVTQAGLSELSARDATRAFEESLDAIAEAAGVAAGQADVLTFGLNGAANGFNVTTPAGRAAEAAFDAVARSGLGAADAIAKNTGSQEQTQVALRNTYNGLVTAAGQFGITGGEAEALARKVLGVPDGVDIDSFMDDVASRKVDELNAKLSATDGRTITTYSNHIETTEKRIVMTERNERVGVGQVGLNARGNFLQFNAAGTYNQVLKPMSAVASVVKPNTWRVVGDNMTHDEVYAPLNGSRRSEEIMRMGADRMGFAMVPKDAVGLAYGGLVQSRDFSSGTSTIGGSGLSEGDRSLIRDALSRPVVPVVGAPGQSVQELAREVAIELEWRGRR